MMRRTFVDGAGGYDEQLTRGSDVDLISKAVAQNAFVNVPHAVTWKRIHDRQYFRKNLAHTSWHQRLAARRRLYWRVVDRLDASGWNRTRIPWLLLRSMLSDLRRR